MKISTAFLIFFICGISYVQAEALPENEGDKEFVSKNKLSESPKNANVELSIPLFLSAGENDDGPWPLQLPQLRVIPTITYLNVRSISVRIFSTNNGTCGGGIDNVCFIGGNSVVSLVQNNVYHSTNSSSFAFYQAALSGLNPLNCIALAPQDITAHDMTFRLRDNTNNLIGAVSNCIPPLSSCVGPGNCGWSVQQNWSP